MGTEIVRNRSNENPHQAKSEIEWSRKAQNELADSLEASVKESVKNKSQEEQERLKKDLFVSVTRGDTLGALVKGLTGKLNYGMSVDYRSDKLSNKPTILKDANLIYPGQFVWVENGVVVVSDVKRRGDEDGGSVEKRRIKIAPKAQKEKAVLEEEKIIKKDLEKMIGELISTKEQVITSDNYVEAKKTLNEAVVMNRKFEDAEEDLGLSEYILVLSKQIKDYEYKRQRQKRIANKVKDKLNPFVNEINDGNLAKANKALNELKDIAPSDLNEKTKQEIDNFAHRIDEFEQLQVRKNKTRTKIENTLSDMPEITLANIPEIKEKLEEAKKLEKELGEAEPKLQKMIKEVDEFLKSEEDKERQKKIKALESSPNLTRNDYEKLVKYRWEEVPKDKDGKVAGLDFQFRNFVDGGKPIRAFASNKGDVRLSLSDYIRSGKREGRRFVLTFFSSDSYQKQPVGTEEIPDRIKEHFFNKFLEIELEGVLDRYKDQKFKKNYPQLMYSLNEGKLNMRLPKGKTHTIFPQENEKIQKIWDHLRVERPDWLKYSQRRINHELEQTYKDFSVSGNRSRSS